MPRKPSSSRPTWAALIAIVLVILALVWTAQAIVSHNRLQNCIDSGRHDCLPQPGSDGG